MVPPDPADETEGPSERDLQALLDAERRREAIGARRRTRSLDEQASASGTLAGALVDLGEHAAHLTVTLLGGRSVQGSVVAMGADVVILQLPDRRTRAVIGVGAIVTVRVGAGGDHARGPVSGDRPATSIRSLGSVLADEVGSSVSVSLVDGSQVDGRLRAVGDDLVALRLRDGSTAYVPLAALAVVVTA